MIGPFSEIQEQINYFFPPGSHPYSYLQDRIDGSIATDMSVLDIGCGHGAPNLKLLKGRVANLFGIDLVDFDRKEEGLTLIKQDITDLNAFSDGSINLAYSRSVMEHVEDPVSAYAEIFRVLAPGGKYIFITPNRYDYASIIATIVPNRFHSKIVKMTEGRAEIDTFPTCFQSNSFRRIRKLAHQAGFGIEALERHNQYPSYFAFSRPLFWLGCLYEKLLEKTPGLGVLKGWLFCVMVKPDT